MPTLHLHLDESGNFSFKPTGTKYYVFTTAWMARVAALDLLLRCRHAARPRQRRQSLQAGVEECRAPAPLFPPWASAHLRLVAAPAGRSPAYVQRQLGHASIQLTVDTYGRWLPMGNQAAVDRLDEPTGSEVVAKTEPGGPGVPEPPDLNGEP